MKYQDKVQFQVRGDLAYWGHPNQPGSGLTFYGPTASGLEGLGKAVYHNHYYNLIPIKVEFLAPVRTGPIAFHRHQTSASPITPADIKKGPQGRGYPKYLGILPKTRIFLFQPHYRVTCLLRAPDHTKVRKFTKRINGGRSDLPAYLGTKLCPAEFGPVDDTPVCTEVNFVEQRMVIGQHSTQVECVEGVMEYGNPDEIEAHLLAFRQYKNSRRVGGPR